MKNLQIKKDENKLKDLIIELLQTKKNIKKSKNLLNQVHTIINKESIILQLRNEFNYIKRLNYNYKIYLDTIKNLVKEVTLNKNEIETLSHILREEYGDDIVIIDKYEKKIKMISMNTNEAKEINETIIKNKNNETKKLNVKLSEIESKISLNNKEIEKQNNIIKSYSNKLQNEKKELLKREKEQLNKIDKLKQKFNYYEKQIKIIKDKIKVYEENNPIKKEVEIENEDIANSLLKKEDKECELNEKRILNEHLHFNIKTISGEISKLTLKLKILNENTNSNTNTNNNTSNTTFIINHTNDSKMSNKNSPQRIKNKRLIRI